MDKTITSKIAQSMMLGEIRSDFEIWKIEDMASKLVCDGDVHEKNAGYSDKISVPQGAKNDGTELRDNTVSHAEQDTVSSFVNYENGYVVLPRVV